MHFLVVLTMLDSTLWTVVWDEEDEDEEDDDEEDDEDEDDEDDPPEVEDDDPPEDDSPEARSMTVSIFLPILD